MHEGRIQLQAGQQEMQVDLEVLKTAIQDSHWIARLFLAGVENTVEPAETINVATSFAMAVNIAQPS